jgi:DNA-binding response OmpR family regulator
MTVLMLGKHLELGLYRAKYLINHGFTVIFPQSRQEAVAAVNAGAYDLVVLSYSLSHDAAMELRELIDQSRPHCPIIALTESRWHDGKIKSDKVVLVSAGPEALLVAIRSFESKNGSGLRQVN